MELANACVGSSVLRILVFELAQHKTFFCWKSRFPITGRSLLMHEGATEETRAMVTKFFLLMFLKY